MESKSGIQSVKSSESGFRVLAAGFVLNLLIVGGAMVWGSQSFADSRSEREAAIAEQWRVAATEQMQDEMLASTTAGK